MAFMRFLKKIVALSDVGLPLFSLGDTSRKTGRGSGSGFAD